MYHTKSYYINPFDIKNDVGVYPYYLYINSIIELIVPFKTLPSAFIYCYRNTLSIELSCNKCIITPEHSSPLQDINIFVMTICISLKSSNLLQL